MACNDGVTIPTLQEDPCNGKTINAKCVIDSNIYEDLELDANSTQEEINQALYQAFVNLKAIVDGL